MWAYLSNRTDYIHYILRHAAVINADFGLQHVTAMRVAYLSELWFFPLRGLQIKYKTVHPI
jgi:hypothetical protein